MRYWKFKYVSYGIEQELFICNGNLVLLEKIADKNKTTVDAIVAEIVESSGVLYITEDMVEKYIKERDVANA